MIKILVAVFCLVTFCVNAQIKDTSRFTNDFPSFKLEEECKSKSEKTGKPTVIKIKAAKLSEIKTVKQLVNTIPENCEVMCVFVSIKMQNDKLFEFRNVGNDMVYASRLAEGKVILIDNLVTGCPASHKANYKIIIEP